VSNVASISWAHTGLELWCWVLFISSYYSVLCPMLPVYLGLLCFSSFCLVSNVASISWAHNRFRVVVLSVVHFVLLFCLMSNVASISWVVMLLFVLSCVQCCQYILGCYASLRSVLCPMLPVYLGLTSGLELWCSCCSFRLIISIVVLSSVL
jgi:phosphatidylserine synthase